MDVYQEIAETFDGEYHQLGTNSHRRRTSESFLDFIQGESTVESPSKKVKVSSTGQDSAPEEQPSTSTPREIAPKSENKEYIKCHPFGLGRFIVEIGMGPTVATAIVIPRQACDALSMYCNVHHDS